MTFYFTKMNQIYYMYRYKLSPILQSNLFTNVPVFKKYRL